MFSFTFLLKLYYFVIVDSLRQINFYNNNEVVKFNLHFDRYIF